MTPMRRPPAATKSRRFCTPAAPNPGRMSSVESILPMLGVRAVVFQGSALPQRGMPATIAAAGRPTGGKTTTSQRVRKAGVAATVCTLT